MHNETAKVKFEHDVDGTADWPIGDAEKAAFLYAAWAGIQRKADAAASAQAAPRASAAAAAVGTAPRASGSAAASRDLADGDGPLAGKKAMSRDQWAEASGKLNDDELRDSRHAALLKPEYADDAPRAAVAFDVVSPGRVARVVDIDARRAPRCTL